MERTTFKQVITFGSLTFLAGTCCVLIVNEVYNTPVKSCSSCPYKAFVATCFLQVIQCMGEMLCLIYYHIIQCLPPSVQGNWLVNFDDQAESNAPSYWYHWLPLALMDSLATFAIMASTFYLSASIVSVVRCSSLLLTAILCIIIFHRDLRISSWLGLFFITIGQILKVIDESVEEKTSGSYRSVGLGTFLLVVGVPLSALFYIYEEYMWSKFRLNPIRSVGVYGMEAFVISVVGLLIANFSGFEPLSSSLHEVFTSNRLIALFICFMIAVSFLNLATLIASGVGSALFSEAILSSRMVPVWIIGVMRGSAHVDFLSAFSILFVALGLLVYTNLGLFWLPKRIKNAMNSVLRIQCFLLYENEELEEESDDEYKEELVEQPKRDLYISQRYPSDDNISGSWIAFERSVTIRGAKGQDFL